MSLIFSHEKFLFVRNFWACFLARPIRVCARVRFQQCAPGFHTAEGGRYIGRCVGCSCNGHSNECDPRTSFCRVSRPLGSAHCAFLDALNKLNFISTHVLKLFLSLCKSALSIYERYLDAGVPAQHGRRSVRTMQVGLLRQRALRHAERLPSVSVSAHGETKPVRYETFSSKFTSVMPYRNAKYWSAYCRSLYGSRDLLLS